MGRERERGVKTLLTKTLAKLAKETKLGVNCDANSLGHPRGSKEKKRIRCPLSPLLLAKKLVNGGKGVGEEREEGKSRRRCQ